VTVAGSLDDDFLEFFVGRARLGALGPGSGQGHLPSLRNFLHRGVGSSYWTSRFLHDREGLAFLNGTPRRRACRAHQSSSQDK